MQVQNIAYGRHGVEAAIASLLAVGGR
jgi:hypothetical protein